jgi:hypothetical protein
MLRNQNDHGAVHNARSFQYDLTNAIKVSGEQPINTIILLF